MILGAALVLVLSRESSLATAHAEGLFGNGQVSLAGRVIDLQGEPIRGAAVDLVLDGISVGHSVESQNTHVLNESQRNGTFVVDLPPEAVGTVETLTLKKNRPHFNAVAWKATSKDLDRLDRGESLRLPDLE